MHFHRDVLAIADAFSANVLKPTADDVFVGTPPLAFTFGLGGLVIFPLRVGASTLLVERASPTELADHIAAHHVSVCFTSPTAYRAMLAAGRAADLAGLRRCVSAGEHLPAAVWHEFHEATGIKIIDGIGSTEMLHIFISASDDDIRPGSTGRAVPGYLATTLDAEGHEAPVGVPGRLAVKGPTGCRYLNDVRQADYVQHGWNVTGDTFVRDADGYFFYQARSDDMIISSGYNIAGPEVEEALLAHPDVTECGVIGTPDEARGSLVTAYVVLRGGSVRDESKVKELQDFVKATIAPYKYPRSVIFVDELPRTSTGKLQRYRLRAGASAMTGIQVREEQAADREAVHEVVVGRVPGPRGRGPGRRAAPIAGLGRRPVLRRHRGWASRRPRAVQPEPAGHPDPADRCAATESTVRRPRTPATRHRLDPGPART